MERCQRKIEHKDCSKIDQKNQRAEGDIWTCCKKRLRRDVRGINWFTLILFLLVWLSLSTTNKLLPFCLYLWCKFFWELWIGLFYPIPTFTSIQSCFWHWLLGPCFSRVGRSGHYSYFKTLANHCLSSFSSDFHLDPEFGWFGPSSLAQSPLAACLAVGSTWPYGFGGLCLFRAV